MCCRLLTGVGEVVLTVDACGSDCAKNRCSSTEFHRSNTASGKPPISGLCKGESHHHPSLERQPTMHAAVSVFDDA
jgi:hypothetical protein